MERRFLCFVLENQSKSLENEDALVNNDKTGSHESPEMDNECNMTVAENPKIEKFKMKQLPTISLKTSNWLILRR